MSRVMKYPSAAAVFFIVVTVGCVIATISANAATILDADARIGFKPRMAISAVLDYNPYGFSVEDFSNQVDAALTDPQLKGKVVVLEVCGVNPIDYVGIDYKELAKIVCSERQGDPSSYSDVVVRFAFIGSEIGILFDSQIIFANITSLIKVPALVYTTHAYHYNSYQNAHKTAAQTVIDVAQENIIAAVIIICFVVVAGVVAAVGLCWYCAKKRDVKKGELRAARSAAGVGATGSGLDVYEADSGRLPTVQRNNNTPSSNSPPAPGDQQNSSSVRSTRGGLKKPPPPSARPAAREARESDIGSPIVTRADVTGVTSSYTKHSLDEEMTGFGDEDKM